MSAYPTAGKPSDANATEENDEQGIGMEKPSNLHECELGVPRRLCSADLTGQSGYWPPILRGVLDVEIS